MAVPVEIELYFAVYFDCVITFKVLQHSTSVKDRVHMHHVDLSSIHASSWRI